MIHHVNIPYKQTGSTIEDEPPAHLTVPAPDQPGHAATASCWREETRQVTIQLWGESRQTNLNLDVCNQYSTNQSANIRLGR